MIVECLRCHNNYNDEFSWTICPHNPLEGGADASCYCREHDLFNCHFCHMRKYFKTRPRLVRVISQIPFIKKLVYARAH